MAESKNNTATCLSDIEDEYARELSSTGYQEGFEIGNEAGREEGYSQGLLEGARRGSELGFYRGHTITWIQLLQSNVIVSNKSARILSKLEELEDLVESFPKTNEKHCEEKLSQIRVKFKQSNSLLNIKI